MNALAAFNGATQKVVPLAARPRFWFPFFALGAAQIFFLWVLVSFHRPMFLPLTVPLLKSAGGDAMIHYPYFYFGLPEAFVRVNLGLAVLLESLTSAVATLLFAMAFAGQGHRQAWARAARRYPVLLLLAVLTVGLSLAVSFLPRLVPAEAILGSAAVRWGTRGAVLVVNAAIQTLLAFTTAWVVIKGRGFLPAITNSIGLATKVFVPAFMMILLATAFLFPLDYLGSRPDIIVEKLRPETMSWLMGLRSLTQVVVGFFLVGGLTYLFVWKKGGIE